LKKKRGDIRGLIRKEKVKEKKTLVLHIGRKLNVTKAINDLSSTKHEREGRVGDGGG